MTRVEENKEQIENLLNKEEQLLSNPFAGTFESAMVLKTTLITSLLIDISKSLAIQADAAVEANKLKKGMDGVPPLIIPDDPKGLFVFKEKPHGHGIEMASPTGSIWECSECGTDMREVKMTIDEAIERYTRNAEYERTHGNLQGCLEFRQLAEWLKDYKRLKDQEPCEDCISRQAVLEGKVIHQSCDGVEIINSYAVPVEYIEQLPSIQPKTGHWIEEFNDLEGEVRFTCSSCGKYQPFGTDYCYNCGAKMIEPQKSEDIESEGV